MVNKKFLILAVILGLVTTLFVNLYIKSQIGNVKEDVPLFPVVVAATNIKTRAIITEEMVAVKHLPKEYILPDAVTSLEDAIDKVNLAVLIPGEQVLKSKIKEKGSRLGLSFKIPQNKRAVSVRVASDAGIAGLIQPGDLVDVMVTFSGLQDGKTGRMDTKTITVLQNVQVLAIDQTTESFEEGDQGQYSGSTIVTFALTLEEAERLTLANDKGRLSLALRAFNDKESVQTEGADLSEVTDPEKKKIVKAAGTVIAPPFAPRVVPPQPKPAVPLRTKHDVEVIKGIQKDSVVIWDSN